MLSVNVNIENNQDSFKLNKSDQTSEVSNNRKNS